MKPFSRAVEKNRVRVIACAAGMVLTATCAVSQIPYLRAVSARRSVSAAPRYRVVELPTLGGKESGARAINGRGQIVGRAETLRQHAPIQMPTFNENNPAQTQTVHYPIFHAALWENGQVRDIAGEAAPNDSTSIAINERGDFLINESSPLFIYGQGRSFFRTAAGVQSLIAPMGGIKKEQSIELTALDNQGHVVGSLFPRQNLSHWGRVVAHAFVWHAGKTRFLEAGQQNVQNSYAKGINNHGDIVGKADVEDGVIERYTVPRTHAVLWRAGQKNFTDLGTLQEPWSSEASAINDKGQVVGFSHLTNFYFSAHAFLWENGRMEDLGAEDDLARPAKTEQVLSIATALNNRSQVVGYAQVGKPGEDPSLKSNIGPTPHAFLWENHHAYDLNDLIGPSSDWVLLSAQSINNKGQIVGIGAHEGKTCSFLLEPISAAPPAKP